MSFGFGVGDFLAVIELANKVRKDFLDAPDQFRQLTDEVRNLTTILNDILVLLDEYDLSEEQTISLRDINESCRHVLDGMGRVVNKYSTLAPQHTGAKGRAKRVWTRFKWDPAEARDLRSRITSNTIVLQSFTTARTSNTILRLEQRQDRQENRQELQDILDWLTPIGAIDPAAQQADFIDKRQPGTGQWLLESPEYDKWKAAKGEILFCHGIPGAGKTILSSIVVEDLQNCQAAEDVAVCYFYCNFQRQEQRLDHIVFSFLKQLAQAVITIPDCLKALFGKHKKHKEKPSPPTREEAIQALHSLSGSFSKVFFVVDALDECQDMDGCQRQLIECLTDFRTQINANIIATSRPILHIEEKFKNFVSLEVLASPADIRKFVEGNIQDLPAIVSGQSSLVDEITDKIVDVTKGMFLLAKLHFESLKDKLTPRKLRNALENLVKGKDAYTQAYLTTMSRINGQREGQKQLAIQALNWIVATKRPLSPIELQHALAVEVGDVEFYNDNIPALQDTISACCGLVTIDESSNIVRLVHYTTQEFFKDQGRSYLPDAHAEIASTCVTYLSFNGFDNGPCKDKSALWQRLDQFPLYDYSSRFWGFHAQYSNDFEAVESFLNLPSQVEGSSQALLVDESDWFFLKEVPSQVTALHLAAHFGLTKYLAIMDQSGLGIDPQDWHDRTPLSRAAGNGHKKIVCILLDKGAQVDIADKYGQTPLFYATREGYKEIVRMLLDKDTQIDICNINGRTPLSWATEDSHEEIVYMLLDKGAQVDIADKYGQTPLFYATKKGYKEIVRILLDKGAQVDIADKDGWTPLIYAIKEGYEEIVRMFLNKGAQVDIADIYGQTPLSWAAEKGHEEIVRLLLDKGAQVDIADDDGQMPLSWAARYGRERIVRLLLGQGAHFITPETTSGFSPPFWATRFAHAHVLEAFLEKGAGDEMTDAHGITLLTLAAGFGHQNIVELLLNHGIDIHTANNAGKSALLLASEYGHHEVVETLLKHDAVIDAKDTTYKRTPLIWAVYKHEWEVVSSLVAAGADCLATDAFARSAFMYAAIGGHVQVLDILLAKSGVHPNDKDRWGSTAVSFAARFGHSLAFQKIANLPNIDPLLDDFFGRTPLWWAQKQNHDLIIKHIVEYARSSCSERPAGQLAIGQPEIFSSVGKECVVCLCYLQDSCYQCNNCAGGHIRICQECYGLGARCLVESHVMGNAVAHRILDDEQ